MARSDEHPSEVLREVRELRESRERVSERPGRGDRGTGLTLGSAAVVATLVMATRGESPDAAGWLLLAALAALYAVAFRVELELPGGSAVPTQPVLTGLLLVNDVAWAPVAVMAAVQLAQLAEPRPVRMSMSDRLRAMLLAGNSAWVAIAPAAYLGALQPGPPSFELVPVYVVALACQFGADGAVALIRAWALAVGPRKVAGGLAWTYAVDTLLAALGLCVVVAADGSVGPLLVLAAPVLLVRLMAMDRSRQLNVAMTLGEAFGAVAEEARVDALTGLANRRSWEEVTQRVGEQGQAALVLIADLDGLKRVNDTEGHDAGDELIRAMAGCMSSALPDAIVVARLGGDEFGALIVTDVDDLQLAGQSAIDRLQHVLAGHEGVRGHRLSSSLGWAATPLHRTVAEAILAADDRARQDKARRKAGRRDD